MCCKNRLVSRKINIFVAAIVLMLQMTSGCALNKQETVIDLFAAKSLNGAMEELIDIYGQNNPDVKIQTNYESSGTLMTQIVEGSACDIFFSAGEKQINTLEEKGLVVAGTRENLLKNRLCVVTYSGSTTQVTGLNDINKASSLAIAGESVPVGYYTRIALQNAGCSELLENKDINECANVGAVVAAIKEHSNEVGTIYYSDITGHESEIKIIEIVPDELTGDIVYPIIQITHDKANSKNIAEIDKFIEFLKSDRAKSVFEKYNFVTYQ